MTSLTYGTGNLYRTPVWVKLEVDAYIQLIPLTHKELHMLDEEVYLSTKSTSKLLLTKRGVLEKAIGDTQNVYGFSSAKQLVAHCASSVIDELYETLIAISKVTAEQTTALDEMLDIQFNPAFQDDTWKCEVCQQKKLDKSRGCGYLPVEERDTAPYLPRINGTRPTVCPISEIDHFIFRQAALAYSLLDSGVLPEDGGIGSQTDWFVKTALLYKRKLREAEQHQTGE